MALPCNSPGRQPRGALLLLLPLATLLALAAFAPRGGNCARSSDMLSAGSSRVAGAGEGATMPVGWTVAPRVYVRKLESHERMMKESKEETETPKAAKNATKEADEDEEEEEHGASNLPAGWTMKEPEEEEGEGESGAGKEIMPGAIGSAASQQIHKRAKRFGKVKRGGTHKLAWPGITGSAGPVLYHGGSLMTNPITIYNIWYGKWTVGSATENVLNNFIASLSSTAADSLGPSVHKWWNIATGYKDKAGRPVSSTVQLGKNWYIGGAYKSRLSEDDIGNIVISLIQTGKLPQSRDAIYFVITSADVAVGDVGAGFCEDYCGWHSYLSYNGSPTLRFGFVGDGSSSDCGCGYSSATINSNLAGDNMIPAYSHEVVETATDPDVGGYYATATGVTDSNGATQENADLCNGLYQDTQYPLKYSYNARGQRSPWNVYGINGYRHLIYFNVNVQQQKCVLQA